MTYLPINGVDLYYEVEGEGPPVLLLHGGFCSLESLRAQFDALAPDYTVLAYERPGHGRSADIDGPFAYPRDVADAVAFLDALGLEQVRVVGYSDGAIIGLLLALEHPDRVRSLVAISANLDPSAFTFSEGGPHALLLDALPAAPSDEPEPDTERTIYDRLSPDGPEHGQVVLDKLVRLWTEEPRIDPSELARIMAPTLVMAADHDTIRPDHSLLVAASIPGAELCILPGTTHGLVAERPELVSMVIGDFLRRRGQEPASSAA